MEAESSNAAKRQLDETDSSQDVTKKQKIDDEAAVTGPVGISTEVSTSDVEEEATLDPATQSRRILHPNPLPLPVSKLGLKPKLPELPPSLEMITGATRTNFNGQGYIGEKEVGIMGYIGPKDIAGVRGVIKQRFLDFMVNEISLDGEVMHLKDIGKPQESELDKAKADAKVQAAESKSTVKLDPNSTLELESLPSELRFDELPKWPTKTTLALRKHFDDEVIVAIHALFVEGRDPPPKTDNGWGQRPTRPAVDEEEAMMSMQETSSSASGGRGQGRDRGRGRDRDGGRGGRGGRGGGRNGKGPGAQSWIVDEREVATKPIADKEKRAGCHRAIRELFGGTFDTSTKETSSTEGQSIIVKWTRGDSRRLLDPREKARKQLPQYIHLTLQKANRETQDTLAYMARALGCQNRDITVCGTKDKRAITIQRVCLRRGDRTLTSVWKILNGIKGGRNTDQSAVEQRGERGVRIGDLAYSKQLLDLGMLKGNKFTITLRSVEMGREAEVDRILESLRDHGFINFYGMQRFGTSTVPTHVTGLMLLKGKWAEAVDSLLSLREGEHPDCMRARLAWLEDGDYTKALELMPRRSVAERCIWDHWKKGNSTSDALGALTQIPRNLRTMYAHAYQSYIWNLVVSERVKLSATKPLVGDLVYAEADVADGEAADDEIQYGDREKERKGGSEADVKELTEEDLPNYTIFDVIMPLPGWNVDYPGGASGELFIKMMEADGLNPKSLRRPQREYSLPGSYRKIIHRPSNVTWKHIRYTNPDVPLTQSDEDKILGIFPPGSPDPEGKFAAVQIEFELAASVYATMALREVTREETSSWHQAGLTLSGEDQDFKGAVKVVEEAKTVPVDGGESVEVDAEPAASTIKGEEPTITEAGAIDAA